MKKHSFFAGLLAVLLMVGVTACEKDDTTDFSEYINNSEISEDKINNICYFFNKKDYYSKCNFKYNIFFELSYIIYFLTLSFIFFIFD